MLCAKFKINISLSVKQKVRKQVNLFNIVTINKKKHFEISDLSFWCEFKQ